MSKWLRRLALPGGLVTIVGFVAITQPLGASCSPVGSAPTVLPSGPLSAKVVVLYFEQNGFSPNASAGIVGNMVQESGLNPLDAGGGLVQNIGAQYALQVAYDQQHGLSPSSVQGQLAFLVDFVKRQSWFPQFNHASTPEDAALWFQDNYEQCSGAGPRGTDQIGGGLCYPAHRMSAAAAALAAAGGSTGSFVRTAVAAACGQPSAVINAAGYAWPFGRPVTWGRIDEGVDFSMGVGTPILAIGRARIIGQTPWYQRQPYLLYQLLNGAAGKRYVYVAEQITVEVRAGQVVQAGQEIAKYAPSGTAIEIGWASPVLGNALAHDHYTEGVPTAEGRDFYGFLQRLASSTNQGRHA